MSLDWRCIFCCERQCWLASLVLSLGSIHTRFDSRDSCDEAQASLPTPSVASSCHHAPARSGLCDSLPAQEVSATSSFLVRNYRYRSCDPSGASCSAFCLHRQGSSQNHRARAIGRIPSRPPRHSLDRQESLGHSISVVSCTTKSTPDSRTAHASLLPWRCHLPPRDGGIHSCLRASLDFQSEHHISLRNRTCIATSLACFRNGGVQ